MVGIVVLFLEIGGGEGEILPRRAGVEEVEGRERETQEADGGRAASFGSFSFSLSIRSCHFLGTVGTVQIRPDFVKTRY